MDDSSTAQFSWAWCDSVQQLAPSRADIGGKALSLSALTGATSGTLADIAVPDWLVIGAHTAITPALVASLQQALTHRLGEDALLAVRSSATQEDGAQQSYAGVFESVLGVAIADIEQAIATVKASLISAQARSYEQHQADGPTAMAVIIQQLIEPEFSGVAFSSEPVSGDHSVQSIATVKGLGELLVDGQESGSHYLVQFNQIKQQHIATQQTELVLQAGKLTPQKIAGLAIELNDELVCQVANLAQDCAAYFGRPQDIEWAYANNKLYLLQSRAITHLAAPHGSNFMLWDNSNIVESYGGVTTPLTFSFARHAYEQVYVQFCKILGVPQQRITQHQTEFKTMLGLHNGRVYYNMLSWHKLLRLLPGYQANQQFMEQMMGVKEPLPTELLAPLAPAKGMRKIGDQLALAGSIAQLVWQNIAINRNSKKFYQRVDSALEQSRIRHNQSLPELAANYRLLERQLINHWDAPLVNDFLAMIYFGLVGKLANAWLGDASLQNQLLVGAGNIISAEPAQRITAMAKQLAQHPNVAQAFIHAQTEQAFKAAVAQLPNLQQAIDDYLAKFADRCLEELKLESPTLADDATLLYQAIAQRTQHELACLAKPATSNKDSTHNKARSSDTLAEQAWQTVQQTLADKPIKRRLFNWLAKNMRARVSGRENLRFERTRVFGRARQLYLAMAKQLVSTGHLQKTDDIFYLQSEEILAMAEGTSLTNNLQGLANLRRSEFDGYRQQAPLSERFITQGMPGFNNLRKWPFQPAPSLANTDQPNNLLIGLASSPGKVTAKARVVSDPRDANIASGEILVALRTDPGWIMLFPNASAVVVERGSLLSHSAIVARELGIPAVVAVDGLLDKIETGMLLSVDGDAGTIKVHTSEIHAGEDK